MVYQIGCQFTNIAQNDIVCAKIAGIKLNNDNLAKL